MLSEAPSGLTCSAGCSRSSMAMVGAPPVVRLITASHAFLICGRKRMNIFGSCVGRPSAGSRACRCTIAAPACAAPIAPAAISSGVTGRCGDMLGVWIAPVTAQVMMTLPCAPALPGLVPLLDDLDALHRLGELIRVRVPEFLELGRVEIADRRLELRHGVAEVGVLHALAHRVAQLLLGCGRSRGGGPQSRPDEGLGAGTRLLYCRHVRERGEALVPAAPARAQSPPPDL